MSSLILRKAVILLSLISWSYSWVQHLRHQVVGEGRGSGVQVAMGVDTMDYGYEYMGVSSASVTTPTTVMAQHCLLTAAIRNKCESV